MERNKAGKQDGECQGWGCTRIFKQAAKLGMTDKHRPKGSEEVSQGQMWGKSIPGEGQGSANVLGWDVPVEGE